MKNVNGQKNGKRKMFSKQQKNKVILLFENICIPKMQWKWDEIHLVQADNICYMFA